MPRQLCKLWRIGYLQSSFVSLSVLYDVDYAVGHLNLNPLAEIVDIYR